MKFFLKCDEATLVCDKSQYEEAGFFDKFLLIIHLLFCKICREYSSRNVKLSEAIKSAEIKTLREEEKQVLKERLGREINKG